MDYNHFDYTPSEINAKRSKFDFHVHVPQAGDIGWLYPMCKPVKMFPGSTLRCNIAAEVRSGAMIAPLTQKLFLDVFAFSVPNRIVWEHWRQFLGATDDVLWTSRTEYTIPVFKYSVNMSNISSSDGAKTHYWNQLLACHFQLPYNANTTSANAPEINALPFRGYNFIYNEFFRSEQLQSPILFSKADTGYSGDNMTSNPFSATVAGTSCSGFASPASGSNTLLTGGCVAPTLRVHRSLYTSCLPNPSLESPSILSAVSGFPTVTNAAVVANASTGSITPSSSTVANWSAVNLSVNQLRETLLLQKYYEALNRCGSRYDEILATLWHVRSNDAVIDIPELIVHKRFTIYRNQVIATADSVTYDSVADENVTHSTIGQQGAYIDTIVRDQFFTKSTTEHGYIHLLWTIRPAELMMSQGIDPDWTNITRIGQYNSAFDGMGDVPRYKMELYYNFGATLASQKAAVFGYQEYGAEEKWQRSGAVGWLDPYTPLPINGYTLTEKLSAAPTLNLSNFYGYITNFTALDAFAKCLAISDPDKAPQFIVDILLTGQIIHPMPVYNIPGMGDVL